MNKNQLIEEVNPRTVLQDGFIYFRQEDVYTLLTKHEEAVLERGVKRGIELARKYQRGSQDECMCHEKNHIQFDRLLNGEFEALSTDHIKSSKSE